MLWKEFIQMRRDRLTLAMMVGIPAIQLLLFGFAIKTEVRHQPTLVLDESRSPESRALIDVLRNSGTFDITGVARSRGEVRDGIASGRVTAALIIPPDYYRDIRRGGSAQAQMIVDAADPLASNAALGGAGSAAAARGAEVTAMRTGAAVVPPIDLRVQPWYNPSQRSEAYIVPGLIGVLLSLTMLLITSLAIVRERERGTLEQLVVTPIGKTSLVLGKILPFVLVGYVQMTVVILLGRLLFDIPIRGSLPLLYAITFGFVVANLSIGLLISSAVRTQLQAMQLGFFLILPNILLSGFMFPRAAMPGPARWLGLVLPLTYYLRVLRGVFLKGVGLEFLWRDSLVLLGFAVVLVALGVRRFSRTAS
jgi:ABC-2 type transport system permease protein